MAPKQEFLKSAVVVVMAVLYVYGSESLPKLSMAVVLSFGFMQGLSLLNCLMAPPSQQKCKVPKDIVEPTLQTLVASITALASSRWVRGTAQILLAALLGRVIRTTGLSGSVLQMAFIAFLLGGLFHSVARRVAENGARQDLEPVKQDSDSDSSESVCYYDRTFWYPAEEEKSESPLLGLATSERPALSELVEEYHGELLET